MKKQFEITFRRDKHPELAKELAKVLQNPAIKDVVFNIIISTTDQYYLGENVDMISLQILRNLPKPYHCGITPQGNRLTVFYEFSEKQTGKVIREREMSYKRAMARRTSKMASKAIVSKIVNFKFNKFLLFSIGRYFKYKLLSHVYV